MTFLTNINLNKNELQNAVIQNLSTAPSNPKVGQIYFNTSDQMMYQYKQISSSPATYAWETVGEQDTNTTYTFTSGTNGFTVTPSDGDAQTVTVTPSIANNVTGSGTNGNLTQWNGANSVTDSGVSKTTTAPSASSEDTTIPTSKAVWSAISGASGYGKEGTVTSVRVQATSPVQSSVSTAQSTTLNTTISLADGYGDTKNPYAAKAPHNFLAGPSSGTSNAAPTFRAIDAGDLPDLSDTYLSKSGGTMSGAINMNSHKVTNVTDPTNDQDAATKKYVDDAITGLPEPMVFKGTLGTGGTITALPTASASNEGWVYKVITAGTYASQAAKIGDLFICRAVSSSSYEWTYVPSGDEPSGTVTNVATGSGLTGGPITSTGTISLATAYGDTVNPYGSKTANTVLAAPNGSNGAPSFRALVAADIPSLSSTYKTVQTAVSDPTVQSGATALEFISNITQNTNGVISPTKKKVTADNTPTENSNNLVTSGGVYTAIQTISGGSVHKITATNSALTASGGSWTWNITNSLGTSEITVDVFDLATGAKVIPEIVVNQSNGDVTITINDTAEAGTLAANSYKAVIIG